MIGEAKRPLVFLIADKTMQQLLEGFFGREHFHDSLGCAPFTINPLPNRDVFVAAGPGETDGGLYKSARELLRPHMGTHERAVVMLDCEFSGSPGTAEAIQEKVRADLDAIWEPELYEVIVPEPEIEAWFWQPDSPHIKRAMRYPESESYRAELEQAGRWPKGCAKPPRPKEAREYLNRKRGLDKSAAVFLRIGRHVGVRRCQDPAFQQLRAALCRWFPADAQNWT